MSSSFILQTGGLMSLLPLAVAAASARIRRDGFFWLLLAAAIAGSLAVFGRSMSDGWQPDLSANLWASICATLLAFAALSVARAGAYRLAALLMPYLCLIAILALLLGSFAEAATRIASQAWFRTHVLLAIASYAVLTLGAIAGLAVLIQERALKRRLTGWADDALPPLSQAEDLQIGLLSWSAIFMAAALVSGFVNTYLETGSLPSLTHKVLLSLIAFLVIVALLVAHRVTGMRGRRAARWVLAGYLLLSLGYPGVKFVKDVLIGQ